MPARCSSLPSSAILPRLLAAGLVLSGYSGSLSAQTPVLLELNGGSGPLAGAEPREFHRTASGLIYFSACTPEHGCEPWRSDGTEAGTQLLRDVRPGTASRVPSASAAMPADNWSTSAPTTAAMAASCGVATATRQAPCWWPI